MINFDYVIKSDIQSVVVRFNKVPFAIFFWWKTLKEVPMQDFVGMSTFIFVLGYARASKLGGLLLLYINSHNLIENLKYIQIYYL